MSSLIGGAEQAFASLFTSALEIAGPVLVALLITDVAFGVVSRVLEKVHVDSDALEESPDEECRPRHARQSPRQTRHTEKKGFEAQPSIDAEEEHLGQKKPLVGASG